MIDEAIVRRARAALAGAERILALTGAGISAESGVPTFRGEEGLWRRFRPEQLATPEAFARDPRLVWEWYRWRRELVRDCRPNPAHLALAAARRASVVTQNVDGLHRRAAEIVGAPAPELVELHGGLFVDRCTRCDWRADRAGQEPGPEGLPRCERCGALARPGVVWFGERLEEEALARAAELAASADVCLVVGTSGTVYPAASIATVAARAGATLIEVNPEPAVRSDRALRCCGPAATLVPLLLADAPIDAAAPDAIP